MNAKQRRKVARALRRAFPIGTRVVRWYMPNTALEVAGYRTHRVVTRDVDAPHYQRYTKPTQLQCAEGQT